MLAERYCPPATQKRLIGQYDAMSLLCSSR